MEKLQAKGYSKENNFMVLNVQGLHALMLLTTLLWQGKTNIDTTKVKYNVQKKTITVITKEFRYEFENVSLQWDGNIDTHLIYAQHIQELKEMEVM